MPVISVLQIFAPLRGKSRPHFVALFALKGPILWAFLPWQDELQSQHARMTEREEPSTDQRSLSGRSRYIKIITYHISLLAESVIDIPGIYLSLQALGYYLMNLFCDFSFRATSTSSVVRFKAISNVHHWLFDIRHGKKRHHCCKG